MDKAAMYVLREQYKVRISGIEYTDWNNGDNMQPESSYHGNLHNVNSADLIYAEREHMFDR